MFVLGGSRCDLGIVELLLINRLMWNLTWLSFILTSLLVFQSSNFILQLQDLILIVLVSLGYVFLALHTAALLRLVSVATLHL